jgi:hypothetical protein
LAISGRFVNKSIFFESEMGAHQKQATSFHHDSIISLSAELWGDVEEQKRLRLMDFHADRELKFNIIDKHPSEGMNCSYFRLA